MWGFNITGPMPLVTEVFNYDQDNEEENIGCFSEGIQRPHFGTGCREPRRIEMLEEELESFLSMWFLSLDGDQERKG